MRTTHVYTVLLLAVGIVAAIALTVLTGIYLDDHRALGQSGLVAFLAAAVIIFVTVEAAAGATGEWLEKHRHTAR